MKYHQNSAIGSTFALLASEICRRGWRNIEVQRVILWLMFNHSVIRHNCWINS